MNTKQEIIDAFDRYCELTGLSKATVSTKVMNDGKFYDRITGDSGCTMATYEKAMNWFKEHTPKKKKDRRQ